MEDLKQKLYTWCVHYAEERVQTAQAAILSAKESSESDTKSSAGDKYETGREMMQQEIARNQQQLIQAKRLLHAMLQLSPARSNASAAPGAIVVTDHEAFYLSISAGQVEVEGKKYYAISPSSPIGTKLKGLQAGDSFSLNDKRFRILEIL